MRSCELVKALVAITIVLHAGAAFAQRKPEPPPLPPRAEVEKPPAGFLDAYHKLGSPRLLIYAHMVPEGDTNELGTLKAFEGRLRPYFIHPEVTVVFECAAQFRGAHEFGDLVGQNSIEAARLLTRESPADYVILVSFIRQGGRERNVKYTQTYELLDLTRGSIIGTTSWETSPDTWSQDGVVNVRRLERYAGQLAECITADLAKAAGRGRAAGARVYTLQISGLRDARLPELRALLRRVSGVQDVLRPEQDPNGAQFDVRFGGDALDFAEGVRDAIERGLDMNASFILTGEGLIAVEVFPRLQTVRPGDPQPEPVGGGCENGLNGDEDGTTNAAERTRFAKAYRKGNEPKIGIMINKEARREETGEPGHPMSTSAPGGSGGIGSPGSAGQNTVVCIQCRVGEDGKAGASAPTPIGSSDAPSDDAYLNAREMEDRLFRRMGVLHLERVDLGVAFSNLRAQQKLTRDVYDEGELARLMGEEAQAQVVIAGAGKVVRTQGNVDVRYTFRAYEMGSARILAAATINRTINARVSDVNEATESMAAEAIGRLACQLMEMWEPPSRIKVELSGARSAKDVTESMRAIEKIQGVDGTVFRGFVEGKEKPGVGFLQVTYSCKCDELIDRIAQATGLPFQLDNRSTNCDTLRLRAIDK